MNGLVGLPLAATKWMTPTRPAAKRATPTTPAEILTPRNGRRLAHCLTAEGCSLRSPVGLLVPAGPLPAKPSFLSPQFCCPHRPLPGRPPAEDRLLQRRRGAGSWGPAVQAEFCFRGQSLACFTGRGARSGFRSPVARNCPKRHCPPTASATEGRSLPGPLERHFRRPAALSAFPA